MKSLLGSLSLILVSSVVLAASATDTKRAAEDGEAELAGEVALMISMRSYCDVSYSQEKFNRFVEKTVTANPEGFQLLAPKSFGIYIDMMTKYDQKRQRGEDVSEAEAEMDRLCVELKQKAEAYGFLN